MALKFQIDKLEDLPIPHREFYTKVGDKYQLATEGEPVGFVKAERLSEFRENNTRLLAELGPLKETVKKFEGFDPAAVAADRAKAAELDAVKANLATRETELASERVSRTAAQEKANALIVETKISDAFLKAGGLPKARGVIIAAATSQFTVEGGELKGKTFSPNRPGQPISVDEWMTLQTKEHNFCFGLSNGGGATGNKGGGATSSATVLKDPTPQQLGQHAADIKSGKTKVEYST